MPLVQRRAMLGSDWKCSPVPRCALPGPPAALRSPSSRPSSRPEGNARLCLLPCVLPVLLCLATAPGVGPQSHWCHSQLPRRGAKVSRWRPLTPRSFIRGGVPPQHRGRGGALWAGARSRHGHVLGTSASRLGEGRSTADTGRRAQGSWKGFGLGP